MLLRKSRADLEAEAQGQDTLARHEERLDELAKSLGILVREEDRCREKVSGGDIENRYEMQRFMEIVRNRKYGSILVVDVFYR